MTDEEIKDGWKLLWDGKSSDGWQSAKGSAFPDHGWQIKDGLLTILATDGGTGWTHEGFDVDDPYRFTRPWFSWSNSMACELMMSIAQGGAHDAA